MAVPSPFAAVKEEATASNLPTLMNSLTAALQNEQGKWKREIDGKAREIQLLKDKLSEKAKECGEWKESASRLREERDGLSAKLKENEQGKREVIELKRRNCDLECALLSAQIDVDAHKCRYKELESRVLIVEKEFLEIVSKVQKRSEPVDLVAEKDGFVSVPAEPAIAEKRKEGEAFAKSEVLSGTNDNPTAGSSYGKRPETIVVLIESDDESASELDKALSGENVVENKPRVHKRIYDSSSDDEGIPTFMPSFKVCTNPKSRNP